MEYTIVHNIPGNDQFPVDAEDFTDAYFKAIEGLAAMDLSAADLIEIEDEDGNTRLPEDIFLDKKPFKETPFDDERHMFSTLLWVWTHGRKGYPPGGFSEHLFHAFITADDDNLARLSSNYPAVASAFAKVKAGCNVFPTEQEWEVINAS